MKKNSEAALQSLVGTAGPIAVSIDAHLRDFRFYKRGVFYHRGCTMIHNHAVLVVGYGKLRGEDYWLVKNSWSAKWGMDGYVMMARNRDVNCGIASYATLPIV